MVQSSACINPQETTNSKLIVSFDVDGTLICLGDDSPKYANIDLFKHFERLGCRMIITSGGGTEYAEHWARKLGLDAEIVDKSKESFDAIGVDVHIDDEITNLAKINVRV
jgi:hydroxymethylpyrimidine pyrophosphatase-like HAD family hydrolase